MSVEENRTIMRRYIAVWSDKDLSVIDEIIAPDCPNNVNGIEMMKGPDGFKAALERWFKGIPDIKATSEDQITEGNLSVVRGKVTGTHQGELQFGTNPAVAPTGKEVEFAAVSIGRIENGKIKEMWSIADFSWLIRLYQG